MVKHLWPTGCPFERLWWCTGDGALSIPLACPQRTVDVWAFKYVYDLTLWKFAVSVLGGYKKGFSVLAPLKYTCIPKVLHFLLNISTNMCKQGTTMEMFLLLLLFDPLFWVFFGPL